MQTLYVDIYFLINFSIDLLSLHMASLFTKVKASQSGIIISALIGALYAVCLIFIPENKLLFFIGTLIYFWLLSFFVSKGCRTLRKIKYLTAFIFTEMLLGGAVYFAYGALSRIVAEEPFEEMKNERSLILFALVILLSIGVFKIFLMLFQNNFSQTTVKVKIILFDKEYFVDALVDSGNFLKDPMDLSPVMLIKSRFSKKIFPYGAPDAFESENISEKMKQRIRIIPISGVTGKKVICGFRPDAVFIVKNGRSERVNLIIAFDKEEGSFAGFDALIPYAALENI